MNGVTENSKNGNTRISNGIVTDYVIDNTNLNKALNWTNASSENYVDFRGNKENEVKPSDVTKGKERKNYQNATLENCCFTSCFGDNGVDCGGCDCDCNCNVDGCDNCDNSVNCDGCFDTCI